MPRRSPWLTLIAGAAVLAVLAVLFLRSVRSTRAAPFAVERDSLAGWTLVPQPASDAQGSWLALRPPERLTPPLGREIFRRGAESLTFPTPPLLPLLLQREFDRAFAGAVMPEAILSLARAAAFESATLTPRCMGYRRVSEPGATRTVYFLLFDAPPFEQFRQALSELVRAEGGDPLLFDPAALSPVLIVAAADGDFDRWMPLRADPGVDCLAPVEVR